MRTLSYKFVYAVVVAAALSVTASGCAAQGRSEPVDAVRSPFPRGPYLGAVTPGSITVSWTTKNAVPSLVQYGESSTYESGIADSQRAVRHDVTLTGLTENRLYHYRVIAGSDTGSDFTFRTAPARPIPFAFVTYGDTRSNHEAHVRVLKQIFKADPRFIVNTGDLVARNTETNWDEYFADLCRSTSVGQTIPIYASPGNHESGQMYYDNLFLPRNNPDDTEAYFSFDYGGVHVISVNTEIKYDTESAQYRWLVQDLGSPASREAAFRVAFWHRPPYSSGSGHGSDSEARTILGPLMKEYRVDVVFNGHDHTYERTIPIDGTVYIVTGGGGAPLYNFRTSNEWTAYKEKTYHFCLVSVDNLTMKIRMIRDDGTEGDSTIIRSRAVTTGDDRAK